MTNNHQPPPADISDRRWQEFLLFMAEHEPAEHLGVTFQQWAQVSGIEPENPAVSYLRSLDSPSKADSKEELDARRQMIEMLIGAAEGGAIHKPMPIPDDRVFHGLAGRVVKGIAPHTEASEIGMLVTFLAMFGNSVGGSIAYQADGLHPPRLFVAIVGESGQSRKQATWYHLKKIFEEAEPAWALDQIKSGLSTGEGLADAVQSNNDGRMMLHEPELSRVFSVARRDGSTVSAILRDLWDSDRISIIRRDSPVDASGIHLSLVGHITPDELKAKLSDVDVLNGFANRFLYVIVERSKLLPEGGVVPGNTRAELAKQVRHALNRASKLVGTRMERDPVATAIWDEIYHMVADRHHIVSGLWGAAIARAEAHMTRLQVIYALLDGSPIITREHVLAAWLVWQYCDWSAGTLFGIGTGDRNADRLHEAIVCAGPLGLSHNEQYELFSKNKSQSELRDLRRKLKTLGLVFEATEPSERGRPTKVTVSTKFPMRG